MIQYIYRHEKDYSRFNITKQLLLNFTCKHTIYVLLPFSKNQFFKYFFQRDKLINDFFISNYDTYVYDRQKITKYNPRAWWKYAQDWVNFKYSKYLLSDTQAHFDYWETLFGAYKGKHFVLPVLADKSIYYPAPTSIQKEPVRILFYGSFIPLHGIDIILKAFHILEKDGIIFEANIIGTGQTYPKMKALYDDLGLQQVRMEGTFIQEKALAEEIRRTDIVLGIFGDSKKAQSVIPNKAYQALACKKALITMQSNTLYEFFTDEDMMMCPNNPDSLAKAMQQLITQEELRCAYQTKGYEKFLTLYDTTQQKFQQFISAIDKELTQND